MEGKAIETVKPDGASFDNDTAAAYVGCRPGTLRVWVSKRKIPFYKIGRLVRFKREDLDKWMARRRVPEARQRFGVAKDDN